MPQHEIKICERCNNAFECRAGDIHNCECSSVQLTIEERAFIEVRYADCICAKCLLQLKDRYLLFKEKYMFNTK